MQRNLATRTLCVRPSVKRVICDKTEETSTQIFSERELMFMSLYVVVRPSVCL